VLNVVLSFKDDASSHRLGHEHPLEVWAEVKVDLLLIEVPLPILERVFRVLLKLLSLLVEEWHEETHFNIHVVVLHTQKLETMQIRLRAVFRCHRARCHHQLDRVVFKLLDRV
jgi:hypothetical protein